MKAKRIIAGILVCIACIAMVFATVVACVQAFAFSRGFYAQEYAKYDIKTDVGVSGESLTQATEVLLGYLEGKRDSLELQAEIDGQEREYYNERETQHMFDVKVLYQNAIAFMIAAYIAGAVMIIVAALLLRDRRRICRTASWSMLAALLAFAVLGVWIAVDFGSFWQSFHHIFFTNDLWQLDPATSLLIRMYPSAFFFDLVVRILGTFLVIVVTAIVATGIMGRKKPVYTA